MSETEEPEIQEPQNKEDSSSEEIWKTSTAPKTHHFVKHKLKNGKDVWIRQPNIPVLQRKILAKKLLKMNYQLHTKARCVDLKKPPQDYQTWINKWRENRRKLLAHPRNNRKKYNDPRPARFRANDFAAHFKSKFGECDPHPMIPIPKRDERKGRITKKNGPTPEEKLQQVDWAEQFTSDLHSFEINEIISHCRMVALNPREYKTAPPLYVIYLETARAAINSHDWKLALKSSEGLITESNRGRRYWLLWNAGFLALANLYKNDVQKIKEFGSYAKDIMLNYPRRMAVEVACWFIQKGHFIEGHSILDKEWAVSRERAQQYWNKTKICENPKRKLIDLAGNLIHGVYLYAFWKTGKKLEEPIATLAERGKDALRCFEDLLRLSTESDSDITIFLEPLIDLTVEYHDKHSAKTTYELLLKMHPRNGVIESLYIEFLETHFPEMKKEIRKRKKIFARYGARDEKEVEERNQAAEESQERLEAFHQKSLRSGNLIPFKQIEKPKFCW